jgi:ATP-dependent protease ClpP protease subunit
VAHEETAEELEQLKKVLEDAFQTHDLMAHYVVKYQMAAYVWMKCAEAYQRGDTATADKLFKRAVRKHGC